jgi:hypothetical protein
MTSVHLYCLLPARSETTPPSTPPIHVLDFGRMTAWISEASAPALSRDARDIARAAVEHDRVIGAALAQGVTPVPASLIDPYESEAAARADIEPHLDAIASALEQVRGKWEMTTIIAVTDATPPAGAIGRGRRYLEQLRSQPVRAKEIADRIAESLYAVGGAGRLRTENGRVALSHLIPRDATAEYRALALAGAGEGYRIVVDGPRAPYSFTKFAARRGIVTDAAASTA